MQFPNSRALVALLLWAPLLAAAAALPRDDSPLTPREKAIHVLNRLGFGPRPGDVEKVLAIGLEKYIERQLAPEQVPDAGVDARLARLPTLSMSSGELFEKFERPIREARRSRKESAGSGRAAGEAEDFERARDAIPPEMRPRRIIEELSAARIVRAAESERQANEVLVDFWMNHFNVYAAKGLDRVFVTSFERDVVRPRIWSRFEDLLLATAKSPAMLFYLDNARSVADEAHRPPSGRGFEQRRAYAVWRRLHGLGAADPKLPAPGASGLNENYARELLELHTLGVDGGYTQRDVTELARALTGWSIDRRGDGAQFLFRERMHDIGEKTILGERLPAGGGIEEGERMIRFLARQPATAHHITRELIQRLVADEPPSSLVERVAKRFLETHGDLRETVRAVVSSPEFFERRYYRGKIKSPFEYAISAVRAAGGTTDGGLPIVRSIAQMGEPLYLCQPPTGYSDAAAAWLNAGALMARLNFALALAGNRLPGTSIEVARLVDLADASDSSRAVAGLSTALVGEPLSEATLETIRKRLDSENTELPLIAGLVLGSPEFQRQ